MPQLKYVPSNERGSVLVASLAFAIIMGIVGSGLLMLSGHGANLEDEAYKNDCAFQAAESGLQVGKRWLAEQANWGNNLNFNPTINGIPVTVTSVIVNGVTTLTSSAASTNLSYTKNHSSQVTLANSIYPGVFINNLATAPALDNIWFDGPFHSNTPLLLAAPGTAFFLNGPVTVHNDATFTNNGIWPSGNNYDYGIQGNDFDDHFQNTFTHSQSALQINMPNNAQFFNLPQHSYSPQWQFRPTIFFWVDQNTGTGMFTYYFNADPNGINIQQIINTNNGRILHVPQCHCSVLGTVLGSTTVVTDAGFDIVPYGDLTYAGFVPNVDIDSYNNQNNHGLAVTNNNFLALVSGGNVTFGLGKWRIQNQATGGMVLEAAGQNLYLTAALIAVNTGCGIRITNPNNTRYNLRAVGCRAADQFFDYPGSVDVPGPNSKFRFFYDTRLGTNTLTTPGLTGFKRVTANGNVLFLLRSTWQEQNI